MPIFIKLSDKDRKLLFEKVKKNTNSSWEKFYPSLGVSRSMFFHYLSGRHLIPKDIFLELEKISGVKRIPYKKVKKKKYSRKNVARPKMDSDLAEILGALNGDGHISNFNYEVCIVLDSKEKEYSSYLKKLLEDKFSTKFSLFTKPGNVKIRVYSMDIFNTLVNEYGLPKGNKSKKLKIPKEVFRYKKWVISYVRGLFDTDGSFYMRRKKDPVIQITNTSDKFLMEIREVLRSLGFKVSKGKKRIFIYGKNQVIKFYNVIKPANHKHLKKFEIFQKQ